MSKNKKDPKEFKVESHPNGDCGNIGCQRCSPPTYKGFLSSLQMGEKIPNKIWLKMNALGLFNKKQKKNNKNGGKWK